MREGITLHSASYIAYACIHPPFPLTPNPTRPPGDEDEHTYIRLSATRRQLPIYEVRSKLLSKFGKHETCIVIGETGSGKTTQIPQVSTAPCLSLILHPATPPPPFPYLP